VYVNLLWKWPNLRKVRDMMRVIEVEDSKKRDIEPRDLKFSKIYQGQGNKLYYIRIGLPGSHSFEVNLLKLYNASVVKADDVGGLFREVDAVTLESE